jgi:hypothetical protein
MKAVAFANNDVAVRRGDRPSWSASCSPPASLHEMDQIRPLAPGSKYARQPPATNMSALRLPAL